MEKAIVFDTGSIISLTANNLLWILEPLKAQFQGSFYIAKHARVELIDKPLTIKRFEFEALQAFQCIKKEIVKEITDKRVYDLAGKIENLANSLLGSHHQPISLVSPADAECLAAAIVFEAKALVIDERTTRLLVEDRVLLKKLMEAKLKRSLSINKHVDRELERIVKGTKILRSFEIVVIAYQIGLLDKFLPDAKDARRILLDAVLWGVKTDGCAVSENEISQVVKAYTD